jgi:prepilin-type processing-associated H-X9-DG protein
MSVQPGDAGQRLTCPSCSQSFTLPREAAAPGPPAESYRGEAPPGQGLGVASLILAIVSYVLCVGAPLLSIPAVICGHMSLSQSKRAGAPRGMAIGGLVLGYLSFAYVAVAIGIVAASMFPAISRARSAARRASCASHLKQLGVIAKMYASENRQDLWPPVSAETGALMFGESAVFPDYLSDPAITVCPGDEDAATSPQGVTDESYVYLGYAVRDQVELERYARAYKEAAQDGAIDEDLASIDPELRRLKEGLEPFFLEEGDDPDADASAFAPSAYARSSVPVVWEWPDHHEPAGGNVMYLDGHVEFVRMGRKFPMTPEAFRVLRELDALGP